MSAKLEAINRYIAARNARRDAHFVRSTGLPGWRIYFTARMREAIRHWREYAETARRFQ